MLSTSDGAVPSPPFDLTVARAVQHPFCDTTGSLITPNRPTVYYYHLKFIKGNNYTSMSWCWSTSDGAVPSPPFDLTVAHAVQHPLCDTTGSLITPNRPTVYYYHFKLECIKALEPQFIPSSIRIPADVCSKLCTAHVQHMMSTFRTTVLSMVWTTKFLSNFNFCCSSLSLIFVVMNIIVMLWSWFKNNWKQLAWLWWCAKLNFWVLCTMMWHGLTNGRLGSYTVLQSKRVDFYHYVAFAVFSGETCMYPYLTGYPVDASAVVTFSMASACKNVQFLH